MAETVKIEGGGDGILIAGGFIIFLIIISLVVWVLNPDIFKKKEGDDCKVKDGDIRGTYKIDKDGKCVLKSCDSGWKVLGDKCSKIIDQDEVPAGPAPAPAGPAPAPAGPAPAPAPGPSKYVKSASFNCHGNTDVNVTEWFKKFIDKTKGGSDNSKYLCSSGGKYEKSCTNSGSYPGSQTVFGNEGLYAAATAAGSTAGTCPGKWHGVTITGANDVSSVWSWGSYLDLSRILTTSPSTPTPSPSTPTPSPSTPTPSPATDVNNAYTCYNKQCPPVMVSPNGVYSLHMQGDGNLVIYKGWSATTAGRFVWNTGTTGEGHRLIMQNDGNLVIYNKDDAVVWNTGRTGEGHRLIMQDDGNLVIYNKDGAVVWDIGLPKLNKPNMLQNGIAWKEGGDNSLGGRVGVDWDEVGFGPWDKNYKFRCSDGSLVSDFTDTYGPVTYGNWQWPTIRVTYENTKPCKEGEKLQIFDADQNTDITSQVTAPNSWTPYDGVSSLFQDRREKPKLDRPNLFGRAGIRFYDDRCVSDTNRDCGGLEWKDVGDKNWNKNYKFRCSKGSEVSGFSGPYGPVTHYNYKWPVIRVSEAVKPCKEGEKLQIFDADDNVDITSQMKNFQGTAPYDGTDRYFIDGRNI